VFDLVCLTLPFHVFLLTLFDGIQIKQVGAPTVPSAVIKRPNEFEGFRCHKTVKVTHSVTLCNIYIIPQLAYLHFFL
jgi:hypothetical protein